MGVFNYINFYKIIFASVFLMEIEKLAERVVSDLMGGGFPKPIPSVISVSGSTEEVRYEVAERLHRRTGVEVIKDSRAVYNITLGYFVRRYDSSFC